MSSCWNIDNRIFSIFKSDSRKIKKLLFFSEKYIREKTVTYWMIEDEIKNLIRSLLSNEQNNIIYLLMN